MNNVESVTVASVAIPTATAIVPIGPIVESEMTLTVEGVDLDTLARIKSLKAKSRANGDEAKILEKALLARLGAVKGGDYIFKNGNGFLVGTYKASIRAAHMVKESLVARLTIKMSRS
jgi:hypothetical protein